VWVVKRLRWGLVGCVVVQILATMLTAFVVGSWGWPSYEVDCMLGEHPFLAHTPGAWIATHTNTVGAGLAAIGNVLPLLALRRVADPWHALTTQLACSGTQVVLALVAWIAILSGLEGVFHAHNCWCPDAPEISLLDLEVDPTPRASTHAWSGCH